MIERRTNFNKTNCNHLNMVVKLQALLHHQLQLQQLAAAPVEQQTLLVQVVAVKQGLQWESLKER
jgi:hypothetical protein